MRSVRGGNERSAVYQTKSPGALNVKADEKPVSTILAASTACQESRLRTTSRKGYYAPNVRAGGFGATRFRLGLTGELHGERDAGCFFCEEKTLYEATGVSSLLRGTTRRNRPTSCPPIKSTGLEIELTKHIVFS